MKKIKMGTVEILGYTGMFLWAAVTILREANLSSNAVYQFLLGIMPNLAAAWVATMLGKWIVIFVFKKQMDVKKHLTICAAVVLLALASEIVHDLFLNSPFDPYDMAITAVAQLIIAILPIAVKDKYFKDYT